MTPLREVTFQHYTSSITQTYNQLRARPTFGIMYIYNIDNKENKIKSFTELKNNIDVLRHNNTLNKENKMKPLQDLKIILMCRHLSDSSTFLPPGKKYFGPQEENKDDIKFTAYIFEKGASIRY